MRGVEGGSELLGLLYEGGRIDGVVGVHVGTGLVSEELLSWPPPATSGRCPRREANVPEDLLGHGFVLDQSDETHRTRASRAHQNVDLKRTPHQGGPLEPSLAGGIVGAGEAITERRNSLL